METPKRYFPPAKERDYTVYGYFCHYKDEKHKDAKAQYDAIRAFYPQYTVYDIDQVRRPWQKSLKQNRTGRTALLSGLMPGDVVVISSLDRLGASLEDQYKTFQMLANHEIRVYDMDPEGIYEWRAPWELGLAALVRRNATANQRNRAIRKLDREGKLFVGVGWQAKLYARSEFLPFEPARVMARRVADLSASGLSDEAVSRRLIEDRVLFVGAARNDIREFTPELVRLCVDAVRDDFPYPAAAKA